MDEQLLGSTIVRARAGHYIGKSEWLPVMEGVQAEVGRIKALNRVADRAVQLAAEAIHAALKGEPTGLADLPSVDASSSDWIGYFYAHAAAALFFEDAA